MITSDSKNKAKYPRVRLGDVCDILDSARKPITKSDRIAGDIPYYGATSIQGFVKDFIFDEPLVLLGEDGAKWGPHEQSAYLINGKSWVNNHAHVLRTKDNLAREWLVQYLNYSDLRMYITGTTVPKLNQENMRQIELPLPPLPVQQAIAAELDKICLLKRNAEERLRKLDLLVKAKFTEMFGDPLHDKSKYPMIKLSELAVKISDGVHAKPDYCENGRPFLSVTNINHGVVDFSECKFVSEEAYQQMIKSTRPEKGDVLYTKVGATYGIPAYVDTDKEFCLYVSVCLIKPNKDRVNAKFLAISMGQQYVKHQADTRIKGIGVPDLHLGEIKAFNIISPPRRLQDSFAAYVEKVEGLKAVARKERDAVELLYRAKMQEHFSSAE